MTLNKTQSIKTFNVKESFATITSFKKTYQYWQEPQETIAGDIILIHGYIIIRNK